MKLRGMLLVLTLLPLAAHAVDDTTPVTASTPPATDFKSLDGDGDGRLSLDEFTAPAAIHRTAKQQAQASAAGTPSGPDPVPPSGPLALGDSIEGRYAPEVFKNLDIDHDSFVSPQEYEALVTSAHHISQP